MTHRPGLRRRRSPLAHPSLVPLLVTLALFGVYLWLLPPDLTWANFGADGGDLVTAAHLLGVAHPTGYPLYLLLARLFQFIPLGSLAWRTALLSAAGMALAAGLLAGLVIHLLERRPYAPLGGLLAGLAFGLAPLPWSQAVIAEVHGLQALLTVLVLASLFWAQAQERLFAAGLLFGLALGSHLTLLLLFPAWLLGLAWREGQAEQPRALRLLLGLVLGAVLIYIYVPLRAYALTPVNWGRALTGPGVWWLISGQGYQDLAFGLPPAEWLPRLREWLPLLGAQLGWAGLLLALGGLVRVELPDLLLQRASLWILCISLIFAFGYNAADAQMYLIPAVMVLALWAGLGLEALLQRFLPERPGWALLAAVGALAVLGLNVRASLPQVDPRSNLEAEVFMREVTSGAPARAMVFTHSDRDTFALWYAQHALGQRPDLAIIVEQMLGFEWYRLSLLDTYSNLLMPEQDDGSWEAALMRANLARPACDTQAGQTPVLTCSSILP